VIEVLDVAHYDTLRPSLEPAVARLRSGGLLAYPTETVYGMGCLVRPEALARLRAAKSRESSDPMLLLVSARSDVGRLEWSSEAEALADVFWPGAVSLILPDPGNVFPPGVRGPEGGVGVRVSPHPVVRDLLEALGEPLVSTSANQPGGPPARTGDQVLETVRALDIMKDITFLDAGDLPPSGPSTVIDCTGPRAVVVREGRVPTGRLRCVLPEIGAPDIGANDE
jgi:L-threonylcarbamoyladenylate synthase